MGFTAGGENGPQAHGALWVETQPDLHHARSSRSGSVCPAATPSPIRAGGGEALFPTPC